MIQSFPVPRTLAQQWHIPEKELFLTTGQNAETFFPPALFDMGKFLSCYNNPDRHTGQKTEDNSTAEKELIEKLRQQYIQNPPEGMTPKDIRDMSDNDLLDMDYFLHEDDDLDDDFGEEGFYIF